MSRVDGQPWTSGSGALRLTPNDSNAAPLEIPLSGQLEAVVDLPEKTTWTIHATVPGFWLPSKVATVAPRAENGVRLLA